ncbi:ribosome maturation factor RimM [Fusibacter ferrireducens]|uniref:Ribosome maturation factor RimM n=1 Tax=Fusibacter ferrireducens TaxID=2785058 RepID=A0ABR9ZML1_9FIRM|nr:ribosome maturation factor RimM [Fusibacter ferrireducens]MBF4691707.1 16S rRNA processing protein RimM [Fusibacter ferrireducens]
MKATFNMGKIVNSHGIKGEVKIYPYTDDLYKFEEFKYLLIEGEGEQKFEVASSRVHKNMVLLKFKAFNDINEIMRFKEKNVYIYREDADDDGDGHYIVDLIGCSIVDDNHENIGILEDVLQNTAQDVYVIKQSNGNIFYLPVVDEFVKQIDINKREIVVHLIEGLIE